MIGASSLFPLWVSVVLGIGCLTLTSTPLLDKKGGGQEKSRDQKALRKMIDALANRNPKPKLVESPELPPGTGPKLPLFPKDYDWKEQERVVEALERLRADRSVELWEELLRNVDDRRYALTVDTTISVENAEHRTVGDYCRDLASVKLFGVVCQHAPSLGGESRGERVDLIDLHAPSVKEWRRKRSDKSLYELQIELCELALKKLPTVKGLSRGTRDSTREKIESELEKLRTSKQPIYATYNLRPGYIYEPGLAQKIRERLERKK